jgi:hypothetical protein
MKAQTATELAICESCKYWTVPLTDKPCSECYNSFCGIYFPKPSKWESNKA